MAEKLAMVVEDETDLRNFFCLILQEAGFRTVPARSAKTALKLLNEHVPDLITLDLRLPDGSGQEILQAVRNTPVLANTKVAVMTAFPDDLDDLEEKADLVLVKPIGFAQLRDLALRLTEEQEIPERDMLAFVVEDTSDLLAMFTATLERVGFETRRTSSVESAIRGLKEQVPDLVLLDLRLPDGSGRQVLKAIRQDPRLVKTKVAVVTAFPGDLESLEAEADLVLVKPVGIKQLQDLALKLVKKEGP